MAEEQKKKKRKGLGGLSPEKKKMLKVGFSTYTMSSVPNIKVIE